MTGTALAERNIDQLAVLNAIGIDPRDPSAQAVLLICQRYELDPLLKHVVLIQKRPYITRDGLLHVAHRSEQLDGIEVLEQGETEGHFVAKVAVYRKDMGHPFAYVGRYPKGGSNKGYGPEMAVKCAEVMALRRAFDVALAAREEMWDDPVAEPTEPEPDRPFNDEEVRRFAIACTQAELNDDHRHALVSAATAGRTRSSKEVLLSERPALLEWFHRLTEGDDYAFVGDGDDMVIAPRSPEGRAA